MRNVLSLTGKAALNTPPIKSRGVCAASASIVHELVWVCLCEWVSIEKNILGGGGT